MTNRGVPNLSEFKNRSRNLLRTLNHFSVINHEESSENKNTAAI